MIEVSSKYFANDASCERPVCSVCKIPDFNLFFLRGEGPENLLLSKQSEQAQEFTLLDRIYSLFLESQNDTSSLVFEGQTGLSQITWIPSKRIARIRRYDNQPIISGTSKLDLNLIHPFGQFRSMRWVFTRVKLKT